MITKMEVILVSDSLFWPRSVVNLTSCLDHAKKKKRKKKNNS